MRKPKVVEKNIHSDVNHFIIDLKTGYGISLLHCYDNKGYILSASIVQFIDDRNYHILSEETFADFKEFENEFKLTVLENIPRGGIIYPNIIQLTNKLISS